MVVSHERIRAFFRFKMENWAEKGCRRREPLEKSAGNDVDPHLD
jgi:hypothetical protein